MASFRAVGVTLDSIVRLLEASYDPSLLDGTTLTFDLYRTRDFQAPMESGISLYAYRILPNQVVRSLPARAEGNGARRRPRMALDIHFLLTAWGKKASLELAILGWAMRVLQDRALLPASLLNSAGADTFRDDEGVELVTGELPVEDLLRIWDGLPSDYQLSAPYVARIVGIESLLPAVVATPVQERRIRERLR